MLRPNQNRRRFEALCGQQRRQQRVFVLAIAVAVGEHLRRSMGLVAPQTERKTHIPEVSRHIVIQGLDLLHIGGLALDQCGGPGSDGVTRLAAVFL